MNKKRIFAIVVFIILGLFMYTFANPLNNDKEDGNANQPANGDNSKPIASNEVNALGNPTRNTRRTANNNNNAPVVATPATADATTPVVIPTAVEETKPEVKPAPVIDLTMDKLQAIDELTKYKSSYVYEDSTAYKKVIEDYTKLINDSKTLDDINKNLTDGKDAIDKLIEEDLAAYREAAKTEISLYAASLELTTDVTEILDGYYDDIDDATTKSAIDKIVEAAKAKLDEIKAAEILAAYKEAAKEEISDYAEKLELTTDVSELLVGFNGDIDEAKDKDAVDKVVEDAKKKLDGVKAAEITKAKNDAKDEIEKQNKEDETNLPKLVDIKDEGKGNVDKAETIDDINTAKENTLDAIKDYIDSIEYTVTFYGIKGKKLATETVGYKGNILEKAPTMKKNITEWSGSIKLEFLGWDVDADAVATKNVSVHTRYKVLSATTKISILKEDLGYDYSTEIKDFNHPYNKPEATKDTYLKLNITDEIEKAVNDYTNAHIFVYFSEPSKHEAMVTGDRTAIDKTIRDVVVDAPTTYNNNKYKTVQFYVLKLQGDRFHCDARVLYDKEAEEADRLAAELAAAKDKAIKELKNYRTDKEAYISEITDEKETAYTNINNVTTLDEVAKALQDGKDAVDAWADKTVDVTFVGKISSKTVKVGYKKDAVAPTTKEFTNPVYRNVTYNFIEWDKSLKNIKANTTITASYEIEKVVATVFLIGEEYDIPANRNANLPYAAYSKYKEVELKLTDTIKSAINNDKNKTLYLTDREIRAALKDANVLPTKDGKYKTYEFYAMKFCEGSVPGFHIDGKMFYDRDAEALDNAKEELRDLIKKAEAKSTEGKTDASIKDLKDDIKTAKEVVEGNDINAINNSITELKKDKLVDIKVTEVKVVDKKKDHTYIEGQSFVLEVSYSDNNGTKDKVITSGYTINGDTKKVGKDQKATVTYVKKDSNEFTYNVIKKEIVSITISGNKKEYYIHEPSKIKVEATYNDGDKETLKSDEYSLTGFNTNSTTHYTEWFKDKPGSRKATVKTKNGVEKSFTYSVSKTSLEERIGIKLVGNTLVFSDLDESVKVKSMKKTYLIDDDYIINLTATELRNEFTVNDTAAGKIRRTNTFPAGQHLVIVYTIAGKDYTVRYNEFFNIVY